MLFFSGFIHPISRSCVFRRPPLTCALLRSSSLGSPLVFHWLPPQCRIIIFNLAYQENSGVWIYSRKMIAKRYCQGFFVVDLISILPFWITVFVLAEGEVVCDPIRGRLPVNSSEPIRQILGVKASTTVKIIKLLRLLKLARVLKASRVLKRVIEDILMSKFELTFASITVIKMFCGLILLAHLQACIWALIPSFLSDGPGPDGLPQTWVQKFGMDQADKGFRSEPVDLYVTSLYWSVMTLTSIGYGDVVPLHTAERALSCFYMIISALSWTYVIGTAAGIAATLDPNGTLYHNTMDQLNYFMRERKLPKEMRFTLREYFTSARQVHQVSGDKDLLEKMSPLLQGTVAVRANKLWLDQIWFLKGMGRTREEREFIAELSKRLAPSAFINGERMPIGQLYILRKGMVVRLWRFLGTNSVWGEDMLLDNLDLVCHAQAVALAYCEVFTLNKLQFLSVAEYFPIPMATVAKLMRKVCLQRAMLRYLVEHMQGVRVRSFIGRKAASGYTLMQNTLTLDQKMDKVLMATSSSNGPTYNPTMPFAGGIGGRAQAPAPGNSAPRNADSGTGATVATVADDADPPPPPPPPASTPAPPKSRPSLALSPAMPSDAAGDAHASAALVHHVAMLQRQLIASHSALESRMAAISSRVDSMQALLVDKLDALADMAQTPEPSPRFVMKAEPPTRNSGYPKERTLTA